MILADIVRHLEGDIIVDGEHLEKPVRHFVATDLMSEVLLNDEEDLIMFTRLTTEHAVRTAHIMGALGIVVPGGRTPLPAMLRAAGELGVSLATTPLPLEKVIEWAGNHLARPSPAS